MTTTKDLRKACETIAAATETRDDIVVDLWKNGASYREIAAASGGSVSHGTVANIINRRNPK